MKTQQYDLAVARLREFLADTLPNVSDGWWENLVVPNIHPRNRGRMIAGGPRAFSCLDLADLLRVAERNWLAIADMYQFPRRAFGLIKQLQLARIEYAHRSGPGLVGLSFEEYDHMALDLLIRLLDSASQGQVA